LSELACEARGRFTSGKASFLQWGLAIPLGEKEGEYEVLLKGNGSLEVRRTKAGQPPKTLLEAPDHKDIHRVTEPNTVRLVLRGQKLDVIVNNYHFRDPVLLDRKPDKPQPRLWAHTGETPATAEFDRIQVMWGKDMPAK
jgi:hypothetical protein